MKLEIASPYAVSFSCKRYHYAKAVPIAQVSYSVFNDLDEFCGVVVYGPGATPNLSSPYNKWHGQVLELVRMALNGKQHTTSMVLGASLKALKKDAPLVDLVVSYADSDQSHLGVIYQATNWIYTGLFNAGTRGAFMINGKKTHNKTVHSKGVIQSLSEVRKHLDPNATEFFTKGKHKYLMPLNKKMRKKILPLSQPYPKKKSNIDKNDNENI